jgi:hypothetical protein
MKKFILLLAALLVVVLITVTPANAAYLSEHDKYIEVSYEDARYIADLLGLKGIPLGDQTASMSFDIQENAIKTIENRLGTEIDHYYIWLTINGQPVLGIDPPVPMF